MIIPFITLQAHYSSLRATLSVYFTFTVQVYTAEVDRFIGLAD